MQLGEMLKKLRNEAGLSQHKLAQMMGLTQSTVANYEKNQRHPNLEVLARFAELFDVSIDYLLGKSGDTTTIGYDDRDHVRLADDFLALLLSDNESAAWTFMEHYRETFSLEDLLFKLFRYSMTKLGWLWEVGEITISKEHQVTAVAERLIDRMHTLGSPEGPVIFMMTAPHEKHTFGLRMLSHALSNIGYRTHYIGECVPYDDFKVAIGRLKPDILIISITSPYFQKDLQPYFEGVGEIKKYLVGMGVTDYTQEGVDVIRDYKTCLEALK
jgi:transcriptional regulator with XRE-family HTH domain